MSCRSVGNAYGGDELEGEAFTIGDNVLLDNYFCSVSSDSLAAFSIGMRLTSHPTSVAGVMGEY